MTEQLFKSSVIRGLCAVLALSFAQTALAIDLNDLANGISPPYSAQQTVTTGKKGKDSFSAQIFQEDQKIRMDISEDNTNMSIVVRMNEGSSLMMMHDMSMYQEVSAKQMKRFRSDYGIQMTNQQELGRETVNGMSTTKYTADHQDSDGRAGSGTYWVTDNGIMVRSETLTQRRRREIKTTVDFTNIVEGDQPDELFEVPANYQSFGLGALFSGGGRNANRGNDGPISDQERAQNQTSDDSYDESYDDGQSAEEPETRGKKARKALGRLFGG